MKLKSAFSGKHKYLFPHIPAVFVVLSFVSGISAVIVLEEDGYISNFLEGYMRQASPRRQECNREGAEGVRPISDASNLSLSGGWFYHIKPFSQTPPKTQDLL